VILRNNMSWAEASVQAYIVPIFPSIFLVMGCVLHIMTNSDGSFSEHCRYCFSFSTALYLISRTLIIITFYDVKRKLVNRPAS
jgi:uncharacterized protein YybS (DUF2232 family)